VQQDDETRTGPAGPVRRLTDPLLTGIYWSAVAIFMATIGALFLALFVNVVLRYLFAEGITWAYEIPSILFPWSVASAVVVATVLGRNIQIALLVLILPEPLRRAIGIAVYLAAAAIAVTVLVTATPTLKASQFMRLAETGIPQVWGMASLVYAFAAIAIVSLIETLRLVAGGPYLAAAREQSLS